MTIDDVRKQVTSNDSNILRQLAKIAPHYVDEERKKRTAVFEDNVKVGCKLAGIKYVKPDGLTPA